jgi:2Fe-2S ferredoxin
MKVVFLAEKKEIEMVAGKSLLDLALSAGVNLDHACGGVCACSTCHVILQEGFESCGQASEQEEDYLEKAPGLTGHSRLACQCYPDGTQTVQVHIPEWNRNVVSEHF